MQPPSSTVAAPLAWRTVDFVSDLHLHAGDTATFAAFARYLEHTPADAVFLLGDIFEVWIGDDAAAPGSFEAGCAAVLRQAAVDRGLKLFFQHGNRDFLVGSHFLASACLTLLADPCLLHWETQRWLLSHGDALCLADTDYQRFRAEVRQPEWQSAFLSRPLDERRALARALRETSEQTKARTTDYADADPELSTEWMDQWNAQVLVHGHTHRPAEHAVAGGRRRIVLSDWDLQADPPRAEVLRLDSHGEARRIPLA